MENKIFSDSKDRKGPIIDKIWILDFSSFNNNIEFFSNIFKKLETAKIAFFVRITDKNIFGFERESCAVSSSLAIIIE